MAGEMAMQTSSRTAGTGRGIVKALQKHASGIDGVTSGKDRRCEPHVVHEMITAATLFFCFRLPRHCWGYINVVLLLLLRRLATR